MPWLHIKRFPINAIQILNTFELMMWKMNIALRKPTAISVSFSIIHLNQLNIKCSNI